MRNRRPIAISAARRWLAFSAALALLAFAPRMVGATHHHDVVQTADACAACLVAHTPASTTAAPIVLAAPFERAVVVSEPAAISPIVAFSFAVPLACGPPA